MPHLLFLTSVTSLRGLTSVRGLRLRGTWCKQGFSDTVVQGDDEALTAKLDRGRREEGTMEESSHLDSQE